MKTATFLGFFGAPADRKVSEFSRFFREANSREKKRVYLEVARKASDDQRKLLESIKREETANSK